MAENGDWLRARGIGRERFGTYLSEYLETLGFATQRTDSTEPLESHVRGHLERMNPAVPPSAKELTFRLYPTSGGAALVWEGPTEVPAEDRGRLDRLAREIATHLERTIATESHATAKVTRTVDARLPWQHDEPASPPPAAGTPAA